MNPYLSDILAQPEALRKAVQAFTLEFSNSKRETLRSGAFDRVLMTGMGASLNAAYPAAVLLSRQPTPVIAINTAELVHYQIGLVGPRTLLWINSQSGRSAEVVHLLEQVKANLPARILACVNDETSPLAEAADICLPINAGPETSVSTKTYLNTLVVNLLIAGIMTGVDTASFKGEFLLVAEAIEAYLKDWKGRLREIDTLLGDFDNLFLIGRGPSMSAVWNGSLINKEAARSSFEGINAAEFRHGPLELVGPGFCGLIFAGDTATAHLNRKLALDIIKQGGRAIWLDTQNDPDIPTIIIPYTGPLTRPLAEILPMELLTLVIAGRKGIEPGVFQVVEKITTSE